MEETIIDVLYNDNRALIDYLGEKGEVSFQTSVADNFRKTLLLSVASYYETRVKDLLIEFFGEDSPELTITFIRNKAIERQYHTFFSWRDKNANTFFGLFGGDFRDFMKQTVKDDEQLSEAIKAFLKLGDARNELVHENFATFPLESTPEQVYELYQKASVFLDALPKKLREYGARNRQTEEESTPANAVATDEIDNGGIEPGTIGEEANSQQ